MADEKAVTISLKDAWNVAYKKRAKKCVYIIKEHIARHEKVEASKVKIGQQLNHAIWARGIKSPPREIKVQLVPRETEIGREVWVELVGVELPPEKKEGKAKGKKGALAAIKERVAEVSKPAEAAPVEKAAVAKKEKKKESTPRKPEVKEVE